MGYNPQESLDNTINAMGPTLLGVHPSLSLDKYETTTNPMGLRSLGLHTLDLCRTQDASHPAGLSYFSWESLISFSRSLLKGPFSSSSSFLWVHQEISRTQNIIPPELWVSVHGMLVHEFRHVEGLLPHGIVGKNIHQRLKKTNIHETSREWMVQSRWEKRFPFDWILSPRNQGT